MQVSYKGEIGLVAGYYESADSARPGYAWFFGRDTLWTTYAINSYGDSSLTRRALDFLIHRQRLDGKIMHEFSQSADSIDWKATPYFYASADSTPLFVMAMWDYIRTSGDLQYLQTNWASVRKAYSFTRDHDSDKDGIYENTEGTGWVESWPPGMPHQEIYLAALDQQSAAAFSHLASLMKESDLSAAAQAKAAQIQECNRKGISRKGSEVLRLQPQLRWVVRSNCNYLSVGRLVGRNALLAKCRRQCCRGGRRRNSQPIGARATSAIKRRFTIRSAITRVPFGPCLLDGFRSRNTAPAERYRPSRI